jgi:hypothetical protein
LSMLTSKTRFKGHSLLVLELFSPSGTITMAKN